MLNLCCQAFIMQWMSHSSFNYAYNANYARDICLWLPVEVLPRTSVKATKPKVDDIPILCLYQCCIFHFGTRFGLAIGMRYFGTGQYRRSVSGLPHIYIYILIYYSIHLFIKIYNLLVRNFSNYKYISILILIIIINLH